MFNHKIIYNRTRENIYAIAAIAGMLGINECVGTWQSTAAAGAPLANKPARFRAKTQPTTTVGVEVRDASKYSAVNSKEEEIAAGGKDGGASQGMTNKLNGFHGKIGKLIDYRKRHKRQLPPSRNKF